MKNKFLLIILSIIIILIVMFCLLSSQKHFSPKNENSSSTSQSGENDFLNSGDINIEISGDKVIISSDTDDVISSGEDNTIQAISPTVYSPIKAVYSTGWVAGTKSMRESMIKNINDYGFNAVVLDIKDEAGHLTYNSTVQTAIDVKASKNMVKNIKAVLDEYHQNGIYVIGRIVTFKDPTYAKNIKEISYKKADGTYWTDKNGNYWPNPYNEACWDYPIALAKEAAELGFDEIQFDYIRFPSSEGKVKQIAYGFNSDTISKSEIINKFLKRVMDEMADYNVKISADVFGIITKRDGDFEKIGQDYKEISKIVDIVCPMVYPSHYGYGEYGVAKPDLNPYKIIYGSISDAFKRISGEINTAEIRPYLQDFSASWLGKGNYQSYGTTAVKEQIKACYDLGIETFTLWDPNNKYCYDALIEANKSGE